MSVSTSNDVPEWWDECVPGRYLLVMAEEYHACNGLCWNKDKFGNVESCEGFYLSEGSLLFVVEKRLVPEGDGTFSGDIKCLFGDKIANINVFHQDHGVELVPDKIRVCQAGDPPL